MKDKTEKVSQTLQSLRAIPNAPFNYSQLDVLINAESIRNEEIEIIRIVDVDTYRTNFFRTAPSGKILSKIVDFSDLIDEIKS